MADKHLLFCRLSVFSGLKYSTQEGEKGSSLTYLGEEKHRCFLRAWSQQLKTESLTTQRAAASPRPAACAQSNTGCGAQAACAQSSGERKGHGHRVGAGRRLRVLRAARGAGCVCIEQRGVEGRRLRVHRAAARAQVS